MSEPNTDDRSAEYAVNIAAPEIGAYRHGNTGVDYFHRFDSGKPGPSVGINRGVLTLGFVNVAAFESFDPRSPSDSRFVDEDFNRLWADEVIHDDVNRDSSEIRRARDIQPIIAGIDYLLDIHSMQHPAPSLMMCGPRMKGRALGVALASTDWCINDWGHVAGRRMRDYAPFIDESGSKNSLLVECGQHWETSSVDVSHHTAVRFLRHFDIVTEDAISDLASPQAGSTPVVAEVSGPYTIRTANFDFTEKFTGMEVIEKAGTVIGYDDGAPLETPYDNCVLVMPNRRRVKGQSAVRFAKIVDTD